MGNRATVVEDYGLYSLLQANWGAITGQTHIQQTYPRCEAEQNNTRLWIVPGCQARLISLRAPLHGTATLPIH